MISLVGEALDAYLHHHTTAEGELSARLREETFATLPIPEMQVGRVEGQLLRMLVQISGAQRILEVGTYSGYSALAMASGLPDDGRLVTCDIDPVATAVARRYFDQSPWGHKIEIRLGPARDTIAGLAAQGACFDLVFIDADKTGYIDYFELALPLLPSGGLVLADNALWSGRVLDPREDSDRAIVRFNAHVREDPRVEQVLLSVRDGIMLARKK
jgi:caffeoyl-CoA O-methyltransferase